MRRIILSLFAFLVLSSGNGFSETILLTSGRAVQGRIIEEGADFLRLDFQGVPLTLYFDEIATVDGQPFPPESDEEEYFASFKGPFVLKHDADSRESAASGIFTTAVIRYRYKGWKTGEESIYIDRKNLKAASAGSVTSSLGGSAQTKNNYVIYDGKQVRIVDLDRGETISFPKKGDVLEVMFGEQDFGKVAARREIFLGRECKVYETPQRTTYFWNGMALKDIVRNPRGRQFDFVREAVSLELDVDIPAAKFQTPRNARLTRSRAGDALWDGFQKLQQSLP